MGESEIRKLDIERYAAGELEPRAAAGLEVHLRTCAACSGYLTRLRKERDEFLRIHPYPELRAIGAEESSGELWYERLFSAVTFPVLRPVLVPVCVLVLVGVMILPFTGQWGRSRLPLNPEFTFKGTPAPALSYIYKRDGTVRESSPDDRFRPGDQVQVFYSTPHSRQLSLFSVDGRGAVSFYQPDEHAAVCSIRTGVGSRLAYPESIALDSAAGPELVVAVFSDQSFDTNRIKQWVAGVRSSGTDMNALGQGLKKSPPDKGCEVATLLLQREK